MQILPGRQFHYWKVSEKSRSFWFNHVYNDGGTQMKMNKNFSLRTLNECKPLETKYTKMKDLTHCNSSIFFDNSFTQNFFPHLMPTHRSLKLPINTDLSNR